VLPIESGHVLSYEDALGRSSFDAWFNKLPPVAAAKVAVTLTRLERGNVSNVKSVGAGVHELKIDHGPGYRVYFGRDGDMVIILLGGGTKKKQQADIKAARSRWKDYKARKRKEQ
jgi:putative addiction module killer protein